MPWCSTWRSPSCGWWRGGLSVGVRALPATKVRDVTIDTKEYPARNAFAAERIGSKKKKRRRKKGHDVTRADIRAVLDATPNEVEDVRGRPSPGRRAQFKAGWLNYSERDRMYTDRTLQKLTWNNLGWRLAESETFSGASRPEDLDDVYELAAAGWEDGTLRLQGST